VNIKNFKFGIRVDHNKYQPTDDVLPLKGAWSRSRDLFKFWEIVDDISEMVQDGYIHLKTVLDRDVVTTGHQHKMIGLLVYGLSSSSNCNNLECP